MMLCHRYPAVRILFGHMKTDLRDECDYTDLLLVLTGSYITDLTALNH